MTGTTDLRSVPAAADETPTPQRGRVSRGEKLSTAFVVFESCQQAVRIVAAGRTGQGRAPAFALLPVARGIAAIRLMLGRPGLVERALLNALIAGVGSIVPARAERGAQPEDTSDDSDGHTSCALSPLLTEAGQEQDGGRRLLSEDPPNAGSPW